jgi:asparagine synthase (glutamine-hydrolysing)
MGAIFGFSGWSGKKNRAMAGVLSHRGIPPARVHASIRSTACWLPSRSNYGGIIEHRGQVVALAGRLVTDQKKTHMAPLLRSYREKGLKFVQDLQGAYVLAVLDGDCIHLARDSVGLRTIYYGLCNDRFIFAVEAQGVLAYPEFIRNLRPAAVAQYFSYGFVPGSETMLENLWELPPGHTVTFAQGTLEPARCVRSLGHMVKEKKKGQEWQKNFSSLHKQALVDTLPDRGSVGLFLSGGLCSGAIGAEVLKQRKEKLLSWSISLSDEQRGVDHVRAVAECIGTEHREVQVQPKEFLECLSETVLVAGEPVSDPTVVFWYMLSALASEQVGYILNGTGGSLVFGGAHMLPAALRHWCGGVEQGTFSREQACLSSCCGAYDGLKTLLTPEWRSLYNAHEALEGLLTPFFQENQGKTFFDQIALANIQLKGGHMQLPLLEKMTGRYGMTPLAPFFDEGLITLSLRMPSVLKLCHGIEKGLVRQVYRSVLPQNIIKKNQSGVRFPYHFWLRKECKKYARMILRKKVIRREGIFNYDQVEKLLALTPEQTMPWHERALWLLITFELWRRNVLDEKA